MTVAEDNVCNRKNRELQRNTGCTPHALPLCPYPYQYPFSIFFPLYLPYLPHIPSLIHLTGKKTGNAEEKQGYNGNMGTGAMMQETGCTILQKPLRKPPVPAHPPIRETCAFSQYGSILRTKKRAVAAITALSSQISTF